MFKCFILCCLLLLIISAEPGQASTFMKKSNCGKRVVITVDDCDAYSGGRPGGCDYPHPPGCDYDCLMGCVPNCNGAPSCVTGCSTKCGC